MAFITVPASIDRDMPQSHNKGIIETFPVLNCTKLFNKSLILCIKSVNIRHGNGVRKKKKLTPFFNWIIIAKKKKKKKNNPAYSSYTLEPIKYCTAPVYPKIKPTKQFMKHPPKKRCAFPKSSWITSQIKKEHYLVTFTSTYLCVCKEVCNLNMKHCA